MPEDDVDVKVLMMEVVMEDDVFTHFNLNEWKEIVN